MKHIIIGTAGHVDHGKTLLIKALTGIETDRLKEEKKRGITIELGFAHLTFENGMQAGIIDVPGHESFIKNMLMGAGGIDLCMLIVAADEGFMPQTVEHLEILKLLKIKKGAIVLTKSDLVTEEWLEMIIEDITDRVKGTFLEGSHIAPVSAYTGAGIKELQHILATLAEQVEEKNSRAPFRLPVDRVFSADGFGTVVTGTLIDGQVSEGDEAVLYPSGATTRIRSLQVHSQSVKKAYAGQRVAINLAGLKKSDILRGSVVAKPSSVTCTDAIDAKIEVIEQSSRNIKNNSTLHFFHGSSATLCKAILLDSDGLKPGESGFVQLKFSESIAIREGDRFVLRFYSPLETIGGGVILNSTPTKHKRFSKTVIDELALRESGASKDKVLSVVKDSSQIFELFSKSSKDLLLEPEVVEQEILALIEDGLILPYHNGRYMDTQTISILNVKLLTILKEYHKKNPLSFGVKREELRQKMFGKLDTTISDSLFDLFVVENMMKVENNKFSSLDFTVSYSERHKKILDAFTRTLDDGGFAPPTVDEIIALYPKDKEGARQVYDAMVSEGNLILLTPQISLSAKNYAKALSILERHFLENESITLAEMRDALNTSRKYALALLEHWDKIKLTKKVEDTRILVSALKSN